MHRHRSRIKPAPPFRDGLAAALLLVCWLLTGCATAPPPGPGGVATQVRALLDQQARDWNDGNVEAFMRGYERSARTRFAAGGDLTLGWDAVLNRYQTKYATKSLMGRLTFSDVDVQPAGTEAALAFGRWHLRREADELGGLFTLFLRQTADGWRIVHDHTSAAEKK